MKHNNPLYLSIIFAVSIVGAASLVVPGTANGQMTGGTSMKQMMQQMMGNILPPGIGPASLPAPKSKGAKLLDQYCDQCHNLPGPGMHIASEWPPLVALMNQRMQMLSGHGMKDIRAPSEKELQKIVTYLKKYAQEPIDKAKYPDLSTPAGRNFQKTCTQCHALPDPKQHTRDEWPSVVGLMVHNMVKMDKIVPKERIQEEIIAFLQRHAKRHK